MSKFSIPSNDDMDSMDESEQMMSLPSRYVLPANGDAAAALWMQKINTGVLSAIHFREYWRVTVPRVYALELNGNCLEWAFDEERAHALLLSPLEKFICGGEEPREALQKLAQLDRAPSVCGRVFKMGEPAYSCRECGMDNTCVLCVDCFKRSTHRHHKYKMGTSTGGGCCDCGDAEAWRSDPYCDIHVVGTLPQEAPQGLPEDLSARTYETFSAALSYCYQLLTLDHSPCLPNDLRLKDNEQDPLHMLEPMDSFCTVLYNDETHTFEQVITTLTRVIKCSQRDAIEYVTNIDREGRAVVKCATLQHCNELKQEIEKYTSKHGSRSLKVHVVHNHVIAHQIFAMKLLQWIQNFVAHAEGFRRILSLSALAPRLPEAPVAEGILLRDCQLWKLARTAWHRLLIAGMLMDYDTKKSLATVFTKNYGSVIKDFIRDDHDHAFSVSSLSVQIYTVPTLAHHLIANEDALFILLNTFLSECSRKCNKSGKLEFERNVSNTTFKRAQFILYDLKYLLGAKPEVWTDALRKGFLQGLSLILNLLTMMQGMDAVVRQLGQHMEFEPEWESAFNLHIKLATVISLALEWCGSDKVVLVKAYRATLRQLFNNPPPTDATTSIIHELVDHSATCISFDVAAQPVSIHLPLSRFLAGLHLHLHKFGLSFDSPEFQMTRPTLEQIIEPVLRTQAMIAQVNAGMWRRNGYALLNQLYFYHNVKCRSEMIDRDIILLQVGASLIESNEFLIHLLNKYNLINWAHPDFEINSLKGPEEDSIRQTISLVEEFLGLLITIIGERHVPGVGECTVEDRTKKEIIQQLCASSLSHSELNRTLPEDQLHETGMENVIDEVAEFKKLHTGKGCGIYSLRPHLYNEYNVFFYHYTREELSKSEEVQRKRRKLAGELECCPPPDMPRLAPAFAMLTDLLHCDVMLHIINIVLLRSCDLHARSFSEIQLHKVLHLMGMALQEQESGRYPFLKFTERSNRHNLPALLIQLQKSARVDAHRDLLTWTLNKYRAVATNDNNQKGDTKNESNDSIADNPPMETSTSESVLALQESEKEWRAKMAAQKRAKIMAHILAMQKNFMKDNAKMFEDTDRSNTSTSNSNQRLTDVSESSDEINMDVSETNYKLTWGSKSVQRKPYPERTHTCILCQEDTEVSINGPPLVLAGFVQQSTVLLQNKNGVAPPYATGSPSLVASLGPAPHASTCGHVMHGHCWQKYYDNVVNKENRRPYRLRQPAPFNVEKQEFLCPLCESLSNTVLPLIPSLESINYQYESNVKDERDITFDEWVYGLKTVLKLKVLESPAHECNETCSDLHCQALPEPPSASPPPQFPSTTIYSCHMKQVVKELGGLGEKFSTLFPIYYHKFDDKARDYVQLFAAAMYTRGLGVDHHAGDPRIITIVWAGAAYSLLAVEAITAAANKPLLGHLSSRHRDCLQALIRIVGITGTVSLKQEVVTTHAIQLLTPFLGVRNSCEPSLLDWDPLGCLLALTMSLPSLFVNEPRICAVPIDSIMGFHTLKLIFLSHIVKIMLTSDFNHCSADVKMDDDSDNEICDTPITPNCTRLLDTLKRVRNNIDTTNLNESLVWNVIKKACHTFLRSSCLFYHFLTDAPPPPILTEINGDTFENMCAFLSLPDNFDKIFDTPLTYELALEWCSHPEVVKYLDGQKITTPILREPRSPCKLVTLPNDYSELINTVSLFTCPNSDREDSRNPTMCLVCGEMLCSQSYCCQVELNKAAVGACTYHAHTCGAGVGIFLRVRECEILLLASPSKGCVVPPPYVDQYGETDQGLRRGNPLHLCQETYKKLEMLWLGHGIHEEISRSIESTNSLMNPNWQHL
ncbi:ubr1 ubiquitin ligase isoform X2 [Arctopsyche grandis]|uniref:ubr1 ubiquitin ligase isoform X2 n=1 Tax=Arctopsyche grandis TaxID=121162 RepID=UPI00406D7388